MTVNEAGWDRAIRVVAGLVLLALGFGGVVTGSLGTAFKVLGFLPLLTGIVGYCPAYSLFGISTCKA
jgi:hypothetical protein